MNIELKNRLFTLMVFSLIIKNSFLSDKTIDIKNNQTLFLNNVFKFFEYVNEIFKDSNLQEFSVNDYGVFNDEALFSKFSKKTQENNQGLEKIDKKINKIDEKADEVKQQIKNLNQSEKKEIEDKQTKLTDNNRQLIDSTEVKQQIKNLNQSEKKEIEDKQTKLTDNNRQLIDSTNSKLQSKVNIKQEEQLQINNDIKQDKSTNKSLLDYFKEKPILSLSLSSISLIAVGLGLYKIISDNKNKKISLIKKVNKKKLLKINSL